MPKIVLNISRQSDSIVFIIVLQKNLILYYFDLRDWMYRNDNINGHISHAV